MSIDAEDLKLAIREELYDPDDAAFNTTVEAAVEFAWLLHADKDAAGPRLRYLYTKRAAIDRLLGTAWKQTDVQIGGTPGGAIIAANSQRFRQLMQLRQLVDAEIASTAKQGGGRRRGATGAIAATAPVAQPSDRPVDANDRRYRGDAYLRRRLP